MAGLATRTSTLCAASAIVFAFGCAVDPAAPEEAAAQQASKGHTEIHAEDTCDPVTFGALCNPNSRGTTTVDQFFAELNATRQVATWEYGGGDIRVSSGQTFQVDNRGGEVHTFTLVDQFGGGRVPVLNTASGNTMVAPECVAGANATNVDIASGQGITVTTGSAGAITRKGTFKVQCCIHPWMRATVSIQ